MFLPRVELLPRELLVQTSPIDHADWNYRPLLGKLQRTRFQLVKSLLNRDPADHVLEVGYGSGVFFVELRKTFQRISGVDPHSMTKEVAESLTSVDIAADLQSGSVSKMSFADGSFDAVVAISALEYVEDIHDACREIIRVLRPQGYLVLVTPGKSPILDAGLKLLGGEDADSNYGGRREKLLNALNEHFSVDRIKRWPWPGLPWFTVYRALRLVPKSSQPS